MDDDPQFTAKRELLESPGNCRPESAAVQIAYTAVQLRLPALAR